MKKHIIEYSKSKAKMHVAIRSIAKSAFLNCDNLDEFVNTISHGLKQWSDTHAKRAQTMASVRFEKHIDGRSCACEFVTQNKGREIIFACGLPNADLVRELEDRRSELEKKLDGIDDYFLSLGPARQIERISEKLAEFKKDW